MQYHATEADSASLFQRGDDMQNADDVGKLLLHVVLGALNLLRGVAKIMAGRIS
jgi:hypothetical protein